MLLVTTLNVNLNLFIPTEIPKEGGAQSYLEELLQEKENLENVRKSP